MQEDWGELNTGKRPPALFVLGLGSWRVAPVAGLPPDSSIGQPVWTPAGEACSNADSCVQALIAFVSVLAPEHST